MLRTPNTNVFFIYIKIHIYIQSRKSLSDAKILLVDTTRMSETKKQKTRTNKKRKLKWSEQLLGDRKGQPTVRKRERHTHRCVYIHIWYIYRGVCHESTFGFADIRTPLGCAQFSSVSNAILCWSTTNW